MVYFDMANTDALRIGILAPSLFMSPTRFPNRIFAPRELAVNLADAFVDRDHTVTLFSTEDIQTKARLIASNLSFLSTRVDWRKEYDRLILRRKTKQEVFGTMHV